MAMLTGTKGELVRTLFSLHPYKAGMGVRARGLTVAGMVLIIVIGAYQWSMSQPEDEIVLKWFLPTAIAAFLSWVSYRAVHYPRFADFLIQTEGEIAKVSWPNSRQLKAATLVVLANVILLAVFLFVVDFGWRLALQAIGTLQIGSVMDGGSGI
jgi:preprotein translocase subunit SecE